MSFSRREYNDYIASPAWAGKRERALKKHGRICKACGSTDPGLHVHHHTYDRFKRERMDDLVILCKPCHDIVHRMHNAQRFAKGPNLTLTEVTFAFLKRANPKVYSRAVMADHTPAVPPKPKRTDGKRVVSLNKADRKRSGADPKSMTKKAVAARAARTRELRKRLA